MIKMNPNWFLIKKGEVLKCLYIETKSFTKYYGKFLGIEDLNISVEEVERFGFIGPNGAGKSTTIRLLLNLIYPSSGQAKLFGKDALELGPEVRKDIG